MSHYNRHPDPEYQRWFRKYPKFPGINECIQLILAGKATGAWADIIVNELAANAADNLEELISEFHKHTLEATAESNKVTLLIMMALELAKLPASIQFLSQVLKEGDKRFTQYALCTLQAIDTREARTALYHFSHGSARQPASD